MPDTVKFLFEGKHYSSEDYENAINDGQIRTNLSESQVVDATNGTITPRFVGVVSGGDDAICILPKFESASSNSLVKTLVRTLRRYAQNQSESEAFLPDDRNTPAISRIALANWLIKDYGKYGLFKRDIHVLGRDQRGPIAWPSTIERQNAFPTPAGPVYLETLTHSKLRNTNHLVSCLHKYALKECFTDLAALLGYQSLQVSHELAEDLPFKPPEAAIERAISSELRSTHKIRDRALLRTLRNWFKIQDKRSGSRLSLYGTFSFEMVWEQICKSIFSDVSQHWIGDMPRPIWRSTGGNSHNGDPLRPDILRLIPDEKVLLILDAKYYTADLDAMEHLPGVPDVSKQLNYETILRSHPKFDPTYSINNIFLFPASDGPLLSQRGTVDIPSLDGGPIKAVFINAWEAMNMYVRHEVLNKESVMLLVD